MVEPVITQPADAERLRAALSEELDAHATRDGFAHVAANAHRRLVFLVPFIDAAGADVLVRMMQSTSATERVVVVRPDSRGVRWYPPHLVAFQSAKTRVLEYWHLPAFSTSQPIRPETFHAKLAVADHDLAYVGSSNLMLSSLDNSLECGVLVRGDCARVFGALIDAVLAISAPVSPG
jgi:phosphatidylserine/phosphatidylglycerophosphate/cardiolipin synthase-like enzyme